jgi:Ubiquitin family
MPLPRIWKSRRLSLRSHQFAEENITQISFRVIVVQGQEKTIGLDVERSGTVDDVKSKILKEMGISKDMQRLRHACLPLQGDELLPHYS